MTKKSSVGIILSALTAFFLELTTRSILVSMTVSAVVSLVIAVIFDRNNKSTAAFICRLQIFLRCFISSFIIINVVGYVILGTDNIYKEFNDKFFAGFVMAAGFFALQLGYILLHNIQKKMLQENDRTTGSCISVYICFAVLYIYKFVNCALLYHPLRPLGDMYIDNPILYRISVYLLFDIIIGSLAGFILFKVLSMFITLDKTLYIVSIIPLILIDSQFYTILYMLYLFSVSSFK